jgi:hypothetical protein
VGLLLPNQKEAIFKLQKLSDFFLKLGHEYGIKAKNRSVGWIRHEASQKSFVRSINCGLTQFTSQILAIHQIWFTRNLHFCKVTKMPEWSLLENTCTWTKSGTMWLFQTKKSLTLMDLFLSGMISVSKIHSRNFGGGTLIVWAAFSAWLTRLHQLSRQCFNNIFGWTTQSSSCYSQIMALDGVVHNKTNLNFRLACMFSGLEPYWKLLKHLSSWGL